MEKKARDELTMEKQSKLKRGADAQYGVPETLRGREWIANSVRAIPYPTHLSTIWLPETLRGREGKTSPSKWAYPSVRDY